MNTEPCAAVGPSQSHTFESMRLAHEKTVMGSVANASHLPVGRGRLTRRAPDARWRVHSPPPDGASGGRALPVIQSTWPRCIRILPVAALLALTANFALGFEASATNSLLATNAHTATANLLQKFNRDAWAAQKAHDAAVKIGVSILPDLIAAATERSRPGYARMWLVTAIADIPDKQSADPRARAEVAKALATMASDPSKSRLNALLQDKDERVRTTARKVLDAMQPAKIAP